MGVFSSHRCGPESCGRLRCGLVVIAPASQAGGLHGVWYDQEFSNCAEDDPIISMITRVFRLARNETNIFLLK